MAIFGRARFQIFDQFDPGGVLERDIDNGHIRFLIQDGLEGLRPAFGLATNREIRLLMNEVDEPLAYQRVVIDKENRAFDVHKVTRLVESENTLRTSQVLPRSLAGARRFSGPVCPLITFRWGWASGRNVRERTSYDGPASGSRLDGEGPSDHDCAVGHDPDAQTRVVLRAFR